MFHFGQSAIHRSVVVSVEQSYGHQWASASPLWEERWWRQEGMEERSCSVEVLFWWCSFPCREGFLWNGHTNNSDLKSNLVGHWPKTPLLAVGKTKCVKILLFDSCCTCRQNCCCGFSVHTKTRGGFCSAGVWWGLWMCWEWRTGIQVKSDLTGWLLKSLSV